MLDIILVVLLLILLGITLYKKRHTYKENYKRIVNLNVIQYNVNYGIDFIKQMSDMLFDKLKTYNFKIN
jgi:hypothetical protein